MRLVTFHNVSLTGSGTASNANRLSMTKLGNLHFYSRGRGAVENPICLSKFKARLTVHNKLIFTKTYSH